MQPASLHRATCPTAVNRGSPPFGNARWWLGLACLLLGIQGRLAMAEDPPVANEYALKATFLYKFAGFVDWPPAVFASPSTPIVIVVIGDDPFGDRLETVISGQKVGGRSIAIRRDPSGDGRAEGHILFVGKMDAERRRAVLEGCANRPILVVGEADGFLEEGGTIRLLTAGDRVRFEISQRAADGAGLKISSKLLSLATRVIAPKRGR